MTTDVADRAGRMEAQQVGILPEHILDATCLTLPSWILPGTAHRGDVFEPPSSSVLEQLVLVDPEVHRAARAVENREMALDALPALDRDRLRPHHADIGRGSRDR